MAIQPLGINMFIRGAERVARDISHVALSLYNFSKSVSSAEKGVARFAEQAVRKAQNEFNKQATSISRLQGKYNDLSLSIEKLKLRMINLGERAGKFTQLDASLRGLESKVKSLKSEYDKLGTTLSKTDPKDVRFKELTKELIKLGKQLSENKLKLETMRIAFRDSRASIGQLDKVTEAYNATLEELGLTYTDLEYAQEGFGENTQRLIDAQAELQKVMDQDVGILSIISKLFGTLTGKYGENAIGATKLDTLLLKMGLKFAAVGVTMNILTLVIDALSIGFKLAAGAVKLFLNILEKIITVAFNAAKAIGGAVFNALKAIIGLPFKIAINGLSGIWESIKRIGEIMIGMNLSNLIWHLGTQIKDLGIKAANAAGDFQLLTIRLQGLVARDIVRDNPLLSMNDALLLATDRTKDLTYWISNLAVKSPFSATEIAKTLSLGMAYDFTEAEAKKLTLSILNFATGMGLGNEEMVRIVENFGQMKAQGKIMQTELRDLARGAFLPVNRVLEIMGTNLGLSTEKIGALKEELQDMTTEGEISIDQFFKAFEQMVAKDFPDAVNRMSKSFNTAKRNVSDFIETVLGWRILTPMIAIIGEKLQDFIGSMMSPSSIKLAERLGRALELITQAIFNFSDSISGSLPRKIIRFTGNLNVMLDIIKDIINLRNTRSWANQFDKLINKNMQELVFRISQLGISIPIAKKLSEPIISLVEAFINLDKVPISESVDKIRKAISEISKIVWEEIVVPKATEVWNEKILPFLSTTFTKIKERAIEILAEKFEEIRTWWDTEGRDKVISWLDKIEDWVNESQTLKTIGQKIALIISSGFQSAESSGALSVIKDVLVATFATAATAAIDVMTGIISGTSAVVDIKMGSGENIAQPDWVKDQEKGGIFSPLTKEIDALATSAKNALDVALREFRDTLIETYPAISMLLEPIEKFVGFIATMAEKGAKAADAMDRIADAWQRIVPGGETTGEGSGGFFIQFIEGKIDYEITKLEALAKVLEWIADSADRIRAWQNTNPAGQGILQQSGASIPGNPASQFLMRPWNLGGGTGGFTPESSEVPTWIENITKGIQNLWDGLIGKTKPVLDESKTMHDQTIADAEDMSDQLVGQSIIPDMFTSIITVFTDGYTQLIEFTRTFVLDMLAVWQELDLFAEAQRVMVTLFDGLKSMAGEILSWWSAFKSNFHISVSASLAGLPANTDISRGGGSGWDSGAGIANGVIGKKGLNFIVPPGYNYDNFKIGASSGEQVIVIPTALKTLSSRSQSAQLPFALRQNISGGMGNNITVEKHYHQHLSVSSNRIEEGLVSEFNTMRLLGAYNF